MLLLGRRMGAAEPSITASFNAVVPKEKLMATAREWAESIAAGAPLTIQALKEALKAIDGRGNPRGLRVIRSGRPPELRARPGLRGCQGGGAGLRREAEGGVQGAMMKSSDRPHVQREIRESRGGAEPRSRGDPTWPPLQRSSSILIDGPHAKRWPGGGHIATIGLRPIAPGAALRWSIQVGEGRTREHEIQGRLYT